MVVTKKWLGLNQISEVGGNEVDCLLLISTFVRFSAPDEKCSTLESNGKVTDVEAATSTQHDLWSVEIHLSGAVGASLDGLAGKLVGGSHDFTYHTLLGVVGNGLSSLSGHVGMSGELLYVIDLQMGETIAC